MNDSRPPLIPSVNDKRQKRFWEPVYKPENTNLDFQLFDWALKNSHGPKQSICSAEILKQHTAGREAHTIRDSTFTTCDFDGKFTFCRVSFNSCIFDDCDFGRSVWFNAKFSNCTFRNCSFSTASFQDVQFIGCSWNNIGVSAEEMELSKVLISNPHAFIKAAYTNVDKDVLSQKNTSAKHQLYRLEKTKSKVARMLLLAVQTSADDDAFYDAVMTHTDQLSAWKAAEALYRFQHKLQVTRIFWYGVWALYCFERFFLRVSGLINGWGGKVGRASLCGFFLILFFSVLYYFLGFFTLYRQAALAALEITLLVGFTKYTTMTTAPVQQFFYALNMLLGLWWYAVFVPTVINRISRVKQ